MIKKSLLVIFFILSIFSVVAQAPPEDINTASIKKIQQEHTLTRQVISQEVQKSNDKFIEDFTHRADFYQSQFVKIMNGSVLKLGFLFGGIFLFISSLSTYIRLKTDAKKYDILLNNIRKDLVVEFQENGFSLPADYEKYSIKDKRKTKFDINKIVKKKKFMGV